MQCVERKLIGLDDDVVPLVPELKDIRLLTGYDKEDKPILIAPKEKITLRFALHSHIKASFRASQLHRLSEMQGPKLTVTPTPTI